MAEGGFTPSELEKDRFDSPHFLDQSERDFDKMMQEFKAVFFPGSVLGSYLDSPDFSPSSSGPVGGVWPRHGQGYSYEPGLEAFAEGKDIFLDSVRGKDPGYPDEEEEEEREEALPSVFRLDGPIQRGKTRPKKKEKHHGGHVPQTKPVFPVARGLVPKNARRRVNFANAAATPPQCSRSASERSDAPKVIPQRADGSKRFQSEPASASHRGSNRGALRSRKEDEDFLRSFLPPSERTLTPAPQEVRGSVLQGPSPRFLLGGKSTPSLDADPALGATEGTVSPASKNADLARKGLERSEFKVGGGHLSSGDSERVKDPENKNASSALQGRRGPEIKPNVVKLDSKLIDLRRRPVCMKTTGFGRAPWQVKGADYANPLGPFSKKTGFKFPPNAMTAVGPAPPPPPPPPTTTTVPQRSTFEDLLEDLAIGQRSIPFGSDREGRLSSSNNSSLLPTFEGPNPPSSREREEITNDEVDGLIDEIFSSVPRPPSRRSWENPQH